MTIEIKVPDIGDFKDVPIIEILVKAGDTIKPEDPLVVLESDKATLEVPAPQAGVVKEIKVKVGDRVGEGALLLTLDAAEAQPPAKAEADRAAPAPAPSAAAAADLHAEVLVLGAGPGGYSAAFRAADLGAKVVLVERWNILGGVCLNVGCIPSKALLHAAKVIDEAREMADHGVSFGEPSIDLDKLRGWKDSVIKRLTGGLAGMAKQRKVTVVTGLGKFASPTTVEVTADDGSKKVISFDKAIIAAGSEPVTLPFIPHDDKRVIDSTGALALEDIPEKLLVLGGGIIGLEMATVYVALGSQVTIVELMDQIIPGADKDVVAPLAKRLGKKAEILVKTKVTAVKAEADGLRATLEGADGAVREAAFDRILVAVGRKPNGKLIGVENAGVNVDERGFIAVDKQMRTNVAHIFAIGDIVGQPMLAHKATHEAKVAAEASLGHKSAFDAKVIPGVAYTDPEVAFVGVSENEAKARGLNYGKAVFPWAASGRSLSLGRDEGLTKVIFDEDTKRLLGVGIVGPSAGDLIAEAALAIEMGADAEDIGMTIHPHPTLSETFGLAAELYEGTITDLIAPKKKK
ncbi:dihydrolipoamide dehydrogenase [Rhodoblastus acidophilus]|uniref:Dihydrolipoyl dehydrogenase n=1 Tax=Rhodoblastus acidophilus TaxID=1074 RepID=A0A212RCQ6_RHOAC|nr:dihydrolipoyl dehydrogenase [Rhodoblastus acidophilus]PPQ39473.1 dihydrolipoyl dehydrogenase [Rhodoblastus acidophilus]RAI18597.1 dihydrolipoyl dehydrogenase [Rhodoblastus acidophilus]SNB69999.1 dihydrolipoamide dehydrogenase [Rhodoblastus acidophilus]